jgi:hypothetical protein
MRGDLSKALQAALLRKKHADMGGCVIWFWSFALAVGAVIAWLVLKR